MHGTGIRKYCNSCRNINCIDPSHTRVTNQLSDTPLYQTAAPTEVTTAIALDPVGTVADASAVCAPNLYFIDQWMWTLLPSLQLSVISIVEWRQLLREETRRFTLSIIG